MLHRGSKHDTLLMDLAAHLSRPDIMVWTDMQLGPSGSLRPDVFTVPKSYAHFQPIVYEVKASVADLRSDITSGKWMGYLQFATAVTFAVPAGMVKAGDIPRECGLIVRHENHWRHARRPTLKPVDTLPHKAWMKLIIDGVEREHRTARIHYLWKMAEWRDLRYNLSQRVRKILSDQDEAERQARIIVEQANRSAEQIRASAAGVDAALLKAYAAICAFSGIEPKESPGPSDLVWALEAAERTAKTMAEGLSESAEIARLRRTLERIAEEVGKHDERPTNLPWWAR